MKFGWEQFRIALGFLTVLPVARSLETTPVRLGRSMALFPAVGLLLGLILVVIDSMLDNLIPRAVQDFLLLLILLFITGALPLDDIAGLLGGSAEGKGRRHAVYGRRFAAIGAAGTVVVLFFKYLCLFNLQLEFKSAGLIFMPTAGRWVQVVLAVSCRHLRSQEEDGVYLEYVGERELLIACSSLLVVAVILFGLEGIFLVFLLGIAATLLIKYIELRLGGVTGEMLGAASELMEAFSLLVVLAVV